jgi:hypothetical protein
VNTVTPRVRRSFSVNAKRSEKYAKIVSLRSEKNLVFRMFRFEAKNWNSEAKRNRTKRKKQSETKRNQKMVKSNSKKLKI